MFKWTKNYSMFIRIISSMTILCFLAYDITWAYPAGSRPNTTTLLQQTLCTSPDVAENQVIVSAKYLNEMLKMDLSRVPLAGVDDMLRNIKESISSKIPGVRVAGEADKGQVFAFISDKYVYRYFNPAMIGLSLPSGNFIPMRRCRSMIISASRS